MKSSLLHGIHTGYVVWTPEKEVPMLKHAGEEWAFPEYSTTLHSHSHHELHLQLSGSTEWATEETSITVEQGMMVAIAPEVRHRMRPLTTRAHHFIYLSCDLPALLRECGLEARLPLFSQPWFLIRNAEELTAPFTTLSREIRQERPGRRELIDLSLRMIAQMLGRFAREEVAPLPPPDAVFNSNALHRITQYMDEHLREKLSIADLTAAVGLSRSTLFETVRRELNKSPMGYHTERRIELAKTMLRSPALPITQIAQELGFSSSQHFSSAFRKEAGQSPSTFRASFHQSTCIP